MEGNDQQPETSKIEPGIEEKQPLTAAHGPILDIEEAFRLKLLTEETGGLCYEAYDENTKECKKCIESDRCAKATLNVFNDNLITAEEAVESVPDQKRQYLPEAFIPFDDMVRSLDHGIVRFSRETQVLYMYRGKKFLSVVQPMDGEAITVFLHECRLQDFNDPKEMLWVGDPRRPKKPCMFVESTQQNQALAIIAQLHKKIKTKLGLLDKDKYKNVRQQIKTDTLQCSKVLAAARERKRAAKDKTGQGDKNNRNKKTKQNVQGARRGESSPGDSRTKS